MIHGMGYRYRLHDRKLPGSPDIVFPARQQVIFVHGCFWHQHPDPVCLDSRVPKSNGTYWVPKLERTQQRDLNSQQALKDMGWNFLIIWECELRELDMVRRRIREFLEASDSLGSHSSCPKKVT